MKFLQVVTAALLAAVAPVQAVSTFKPARPPAAPLAVRSPYLNVWLNGRTDGQPSGYLPGQWPRFWTTGVNGWQGYVMVDGVAYNWMGGAPSDNYADQTSQEYTSTSTVFTFSIAGKVQLTASFLSPAFPKDLKRQSITSSYLSVSAKSLDGRSHKVQVYCDVSAEWASGDSNAIVNWETSTAPGVYYHKFWRANQDTFNEANDQASWGNWWWAVGRKEGVTIQIGQDTIVRQQFTKNGVLTGTIDKDFRAVSDRWPVFAFSQDLGAVGSHDVSTLFTIGYTQKEAILYQGQGDAPTHQPSLWTSYFGEDDIVSWFFNDYANQLHSANRLDIQVHDDSFSAGGEDYATITSLAFRQAFGGIAYTGTPDNVKVFLKEISSDSDIQTVDVLFPAYPIFLYLDPELIRYTLAPLLENQESGHYPNNYSMHDMGRYPQALGYPAGNDEEMPLEECGNMIVMMLSYAQVTGNNSYLGAHWPLLQKWAGYMIQDAKIPANQLSTDDFQGHLANQTDLAIKGIIALEAMSRIAQLTGHKDDSTRYSKIAHEYLDFWQAHGIVGDASPPHTNLQYNTNDTYGLLYNSYADKVLGLNFLPQQVFDMQSDFYDSVAGKYGVILDTRGTLTKVDWEIFAAAVSKPKTQNMFISKIAKWINETPTFRAFTDLYDVNDGGYARGIQFTARPVVGGVFAILGLQKAISKH